MTGRALVLLGGLVLAACSRHQPPQEPPALAVPAAAEPGRREVTFARQELAPGHWRLHVRWGPAVAPAGGSMAIMHECGRLTADEGYTWFVLDEQQRRDPPAERSSRVTLRLSHEVPEGHTPVRFDAPDGGSALMAAVGATRQALHAPSLLETFDQLAAARPSPTGNASPPAPVDDEPEAWTRTLFFEDPGLGTLRSLTWVDDRLALAGQRALAWISAEGQVLERVDLAREMTCPVPVDVDGDGRWEVLDAGGGWSAVGLADDRGQPLWSVDGGWLSPAPNGLTAADLDGDGTLEFLVGFNGGGGLTLYDAAGAEVWSVAGRNVFHADAFDLDGDGQPEIVHAAGGGLVARDRQGRQLDVPLPELSSFCTVSDRTGRPVLGAIVGGAARLFDPIGGAELARFTVPRGGHDDFALAWLEQGERTVAAVARTLGASNGVAELLLFDADSGARLWHQQLPVAYLSLATVPGADGQDLLVAAGSQVWRYRPAD